MSSTRLSGASRRGRAEPRAARRRAGVRLRAAGLSWLAGVLLMAGGLLAGPAAAQSSEDERPAPRSAVDMPMDLLFDRLAASPSRRAATPFEAEILRRFHNSGSDTADLLLKWSAEAVNDKEYGVALDLLDRLIILQPDFAEAWNKRATVHFVNEDFGKALSDLRRTLALEPRHFGALSGLGVILREVDRTETAIAVLRQALAVHPHMEDAKELLDKLEAQQAGHDI